MGHDRLFLGGKSKRRAQQAANRIGTAAAINYNDALVAPSLGTTSTQGAIDALKAGAGAGGTVLWKPAGPADPGVYTDWAGVMSIVSASAAPVLVLVDRVDGDPPLVIPPGNYEMKHAVIEAVHFGDASVGDIDMQDGAVLRNFSLAGSLTLRGNPTAAPCIIQDPVSPFSPRTMVMFNGAQLANTGTRPMIDVADGDFFQLAIEGAGGIAAGNPATGIVGLGIGSLLVLNTLGWLFTLDPSFVVGDPTTLCLFWHSGEIPFPIPALPNFAGFVANTPHGLVGGSGPSAARPIPTFAPLSTGVMYLDTTLGIPIWWDDVAGFWRDATGVGPV